MPGRGPNRTIVFGPGDKLRWLEGVVCNPGTNHIDASVAVAITNRIDKFTGAAIISQAWLAIFAGATDRGVRISIGRMETLNLLLIERPRPMPGGRGKANIYRPLLTRNGRSGLIERNPEQPLQELRNSAAANGERSTSKTGTVVPTLPNTYLISSGANCGEADASGDVLWRSIKSNLATKLTLDVTEAWFGQVRINSIEDSEIVLIASNRFQAAYIENHFWRQVLDACQVCRPDITHWRVIVVT